MSNIEFPPVPFKQLPSVIKKLPVPIINAPTTNNLSGAINGRLSSLGSLLPYVPIVGGLYDIYEGAKKIKNGDDRGWSQLGLGTAGLVPAGTMARYARLGQLAKVGGKTKAMAYGLPTAGYVMGNMPREEVVQQQPEPLETIQQPTVVKGMRYTELPDPDNVNKIAEDLQYLLQSGELPVKHNQSTKAVNLPPLPPLVEQGGVGGQVAQPATVVPQQQPIEDTPMLQGGVEEKGLAIPDLIKKYGEELDKISNADTGALEDVLANYQEYLANSDRRRRYYTAIAGITGNKGYLDIANANDPIQVGLNKAQITNAINKAKLNAIQSKYGAIGNEIVARDIGLPAGSGLADKNMLSAYANQQRARMGLEGKQYTADKNYDIAQLKAMAQALATDARLSSKERIAYAQLANKLNIAQMNALTSPYRYGYNISPEYVDLINSGAKITQPITPTYGGPMGMQPNGMVNFGRLIQ